MHLRPAIASHNVRSQARAQAKAKAAGKILTDAELDGVAGGSVAQAIAAGQSLNDADREQLQSVLRQANEYVGTAAAIINSTATVR